MCLRWQSCCSKGWMPPGHRWSRQSAGFLLPSVKRLHCKPCKDLCEKPSEPMAFSQQVQCLAWMIFGFMGLEFCSSNPVLRFGRLYLLNPTYSILGLRFTLLLVIYHLLDYMFGSLPVVLDLLLVSSRCCLNVITSVTTSDHGWKINCWNLQPSPMKRKENDLNQTSMITCKMLIELR